MFALHITKLLQDMVEVAAQDGDSGVVRAEGGLADLQGLLKLGAGAGEFAYLAGMPPAVSDGAVPSARSASYRLAPSNLLYKRGRIATIGDGDCLAMGKGGAPMASPATSRAELRAYFPAVTMPSRFIRDERLHGLSVELAPSRGSPNPWARTGKFGAVFKFEGKGQTFALKVFLRDVPDRGRRYRLIHEHLATMKPLSRRLITFSYDEAGIRVKGIWYPTLIMDWSSGVPLDRYLQEQLDAGRLDKARLCREWVETIQELRSHGIAHGDLQHENILVQQDGTLQLIDYDGMFVPSMRHGFRAREAGRPAYQHPQRSPRSRRDFFDERLDDFSAMAILLNLAAVDARLWAKYHGQHDDRLLISEQDLREPTTSTLLVSLARRPGPIARLARLVTEAARSDLEAVLPFDAVVADAGVRRLLAATTPAKLPAPQRTRPRLPPGVLPGSPKAKTRASSAVPARRSSPKATTPALTDRELDVARLLAQGLSPEQIPARLQLAPTTAVRYIRTLRAKTASDSIEALAAWARAQFPVPPPSKPAKPRPRPTRKPHTQTVAKPVSPAAKKPPSSQPARRPAARAPIAYSSKPQAEQPPAAGPPQPMPDLLGNLRGPSVSPGRVERMPTPGQPNTVDAGPLGLLGRLRDNAFLLQLAEGKRLTAEGEAHLEGNRNDEALTAFNQALATTQDYVPALVGRGEAYRRRRQFDQALSDLNRAIKLQPSNARALRVRSETNRDAGRQTRAFADRLRARFYER